VPLVFFLVALVVTNRPCPDITHLLVNGQTHELVKLRTYHAVWCENSGLEAMPGKQVNRFDLADN